MTATLEDTQAALITNLKTSPPSPVLAEEIREREWQGVNFSYPCIRVRVETFEDVNGCNQYIASGNFLIFSEQESSLQANQIAGLIRSRLARKSFSAPNGIKFTGFICTQIGAQRMPESLVWQSEVQFKVTVS